jgi:hypothetical protein
LIEIIKAWSWLPEALKAGVLAIDQPTFTALGGSANEKILARRGRRP